MNPDDWDFYCGGSCLDDDDYDDDWNSGYGDAAADGFYPDDDVSDIFDPVLDNHFDDDERIITPFDMGSDAIGDADAEFDLNQEPHGVNDDDEFDLNQDTNVVEDAEFDLDDPRGDGDFEYAIGGVEIHGGEVGDDVEDADEGEFFMTVRVRESSSSVDRVRNGTDVFDTVFPARRRLNEEMQEKIMILEAKCASLELKDAEWSKKEVEWNQKEAELRNQLNQQKWVPWF